MKAPSLYRLEADVEALAELMADVIDSGADDAAVNEIVDSWLAELGEDMATRGARFIRWRANELALADAAKAEAARLSALAKRRASHVDRVEDAFLRLMLRTGATILETDVGMVTARKAGGAPAVEIAPDVDVRTLPADCVKVTHEAIRSALLARIKAGESFPGVTLKPKGFTLGVK